MAQSLLQVNINQSTTPSSNEVTQPSKFFVMFLQQLSTCNYYAFVMTTNQIVDVGTAHITIPEKEVINLAVLFFH